MDDNSIAISDNLTNERTNERTVISGIYINESERFRTKPLKGLIRTIKTDADRSAGYVAKIHRS